MSATGTVKVYVAGTEALRDETLFARLCASVSVERREKIDRLTLDKDKRLSLGAELLLSRALADAGVERYRVVCDGRTGKPYLADRENLFFNLSHAEERVMCVLSDEEVGCDVEYVRAGKIAVAERFFSPSEYAAILCEPTPSAQNAMFFRLWTLKESYIKATGMGMALPLGSFSVEIENGTVSLLGGHNGEDYRFREYDLGDGYAYAVCGISAVFEEAKLCRLV